MEMTNGRGPDSCIDAVGCEAHSSSGLSTVLDQAKAVVALPRIVRTYFGRQFFVAAREERFLFPASISAFLTKFHSAQP